MDGIINVKGAIIITFKYIELFAGIGGFRSALDPLGGECVFASEIDPFAMISYSALYGGEIPNGVTPITSSLGKYLIGVEGAKYASELSGDITKIDAHSIPDHDVLVGGFPCQAFSVAGQRKGFEDARGTLFFEIARIASAKQPRLMLLENVKGLLSHDGGHTIEVMASVLNDIGYAIDFRVLNSKHYGVPQNRERIFIVCDRDVEHADWIVSGNDVVAKAKRRIQALGVRTFNFDWSTNSTVTTRLRDVLEPDVDERYYLSEEKTAKLITQLEERGKVNDSDDCEMIGHVDGINGHDICRRVYTPTGVAPTIPTGSSGNTTPKIAVEFSRKGGIGKTLDTAHTLSASDWRGLNRNQTQNAVLEFRAVLTPDRDEKRQNGRRFKEDGEESFTLTAQDKHGVAIGKYPRYRIRKLTPLECWRLQGFSDAQHAMVAAAGVSDSQRYKQAGNAVTVNVISAIGKRLIPRLIPINSEFIAIDTDKPTEVTR